MTRCAAGLIIAPVSYSFGVDYYPEHWPEERWETDARLMAGMGLELVRLAEFAWKKLEPAEGSFEFGWLDRALAALDRHGLKAVLGTPTAAPPAWLIEANPEVLPLDSQGRRVSFGGRHHDCQSSPAYRRHAQRIVGAMARRFGTDPRVVGWQVDNELGNSHEDLCHCESCRTAFHAWLELRYGSVDALNQAWGTQFWSQGYDSFDQVPTPAFTITAHSPSLLLDWKRFHSDLVVEFQELQLSVIRAEAPGHFVTHNMMGFADLVDYFDLGADLDFVSHDQYPLGFWQAPRAPAELAAALDLMAGIKGKPFWVMEQQAGMTGWQVMAQAPRPGQLALWAAQSVARGADTVLFFRWRTCLSGTEQYWHGILPHDGRPGRRYEELKVLVAALKPQMARFAGSLSGAEVGILYSYEQNWAFEIQPHHPDLDYITYVQRIHASFHERNVPVAFLAPGASLDGYRLIVAPLLYIEIPGLAERLRAFVEGGGTLLLTMRTGVKDAANVCLATSPLPGPYAELLGLEILDYDCLRSGPVPVALVGPPNSAMQGALAAGSGELWWDCIETRGARPWAAGLLGPHAGEAIVTRQRLGAGEAWYLGTSPDSGLMGLLCAELLASAGVEGLGPSPEGVELCRRRTGSCDFLFALNHTGEAKRFGLEAGWTRLVGPEDMPPYGFQVYERGR